MEVMDNGSAEDDENVDGGDVYTRCVPVAMSCAARALIFLSSSNFKHPAASYRDVHWA
jgi:hypothetical protein